MKRRGNRIILTNLAFIATFMSVVGGVVGYMLGSFLFSEIYPYIISYGYAENFEISKEYFIEYGGRKLLC